MIGGGYGTGREVVEYFTMQGVTGGVLGLGVATLTFALILAATYEFARCFRAYDYRHFFKTLIGRGWVAYEVVYIITIMLILAVVSSAASDVLKDQLGWSAWLSTGAMLIAVTTMAFYGREFVSRIMTFWAILLSAIFVLYFVLVVAQFGPETAAAWEAGGVAGSWARKGMQFALYNVAMAPALLFAAREIATRREAILAGVITALAATLPALLFHLSFVARYAEVSAQPLPVYWMISSLGANWFMSLYLIGLFGTLVQTGIGVIQGLIERIDGWRKDSGGAPLGKPGHALLGLAAITISGMLSAVGIITLVAQGYGSLAWAFMIIYPLPLLTVGLLRLARARTAT
ncbi:MAG: hypothetical protein EPO25_10625 [Gammaproteobacteria bacterium]|nr:MAG: hypothetical protein EPO25_10625 [Gammaproteobacteria bacterium]